MEPAPSGGGPDNKGVSETSLTFSPAGLGVSGQSIYTVAIAIGAILHGRENPTPLAVPRDSKQ